jgi:uncharacterized Zn-finger protein
MASPPNKTCQEAIKAENIQEQQNLKEDSNAGSTGLRIERPTASTPSSTGSITSSSSSSSSAGGKYVCNVCKKDFPTNALLNIHAKIHYFERPYRCDACAVSFRTNGHLQKHKRSSSHFNKVNINATFGEQVPVILDLFIVETARLGSEFMGIWLNICDQKVTS